MKAIFKYTLLCLMCILFLQDIQAQLYDNTFNSTGVWNRQIRNLNNSLNSIVLQPDGKILYTGYTHDIVATDPSYFAVGRINTNGTNDNSFDTDGAVEYIFNTGGSDGAFSACYLNGKIYCTGSNFDGTTSYNLLVRLNSDGSLDNSFNGNGKLEPLIEPYSNGTDVVVKSNDNKLIVLGSSASAFNTYHLSGFKVDDNANYDNSFGNSGKTILNDISGTISPDQVEILNDNSILLVYQNDLIKIKSNGHLDSTFGLNGVLDLNSLTTKNILGIAIQKDGKIVLCNGDNNQKFSVYRLNSDASVDNTFGTNGKVIVPFNGVSNQANTIVVDTSSLTGKIYAAGFSAYNGGLISYFALARISPVDGSIEAKAEFQPNNLNANTEDILLQPDGKVIIAGNSIAYPTQDFIVTRINQNFTTVVATGIEVSTTVSIGINIFPNPANHYVNVNSNYTIEEVRVLDVLGNEVLRQTKSGNTQIDISSLPKGLYNFVITTDKGTGSKKVSIQ